MGSGCIVSLVTMAQWTQHTNDSSNIAVPYCFYEATQIELKETRNGEDTPVQM